VNAYTEVQDGKKIAIGPHFVVRGNQKNYVQFISTNIPKKVDNVYFEDVVAKAILFRTAAKLYNANTSLQRASAYIYVPYTLSYLSFRVKEGLDLYKIWRNQSLSEELKEVIGDLLQQVHDHIYQKSLSLNKRPDEWAKKEECWLDMKMQKFQIDISKLNSDLENPKKPTIRRRLTDEDTITQMVEEQTEKIRSVPPVVWHKIENWGRVTKELTDQQLNVAFNLSGKVRNRSKISEYERQAGIVILDKVIENVPDLLFEIEDEEAHDAKNEVEITIDLVSRMVAWDRKNKRLKDFQFTFMNEITNGKRSLNEHTKKIVALNLKTLKKFGFK
jgi:hypothetical protein